MKTDSIFYRLFQQFPSIFFELIDNPPETANIYQFASIETILVYKFPQMSRQEIEAMFGLSELKQTRVYQEALEEGEQKAKLEAVPKLLALGLTVEQIAQALDLDTAQVQELAQQER
ncbi:hypothetical protein CEN45_08230 [Fischerella thermalis CCMEE 5198]|nr:DUF2887 domain-containing protein [Fischerella thermalis]PLZ86477.1 hypothetical protein CI594_22050 [Fischerella thermalis CCMEE 5196]PMB24415.1 hypothetical protein CEN45_08230 [Fischerella thermalis CCMEE 5198]